MATVKSTPFAAFPHIVRLTDGRVIEICCPHCNGNARSRNPYSFFEGLSGIIQHILQIHKDTTINKKAYLALPNLHVLSHTDVDKIAKGQYEGIINKRSVANKDGQQAKVVKDDKDVAISHYPFIISTEHGTYIQLACCFCTGNAQTKTGSNRRKSTQKDKLAFYHGVPAIQGHIAQSHKDQLKILALQNVSREWVVENCGTYISNDRVDELQEDVKLRKIQPIKAQVQDKGKEDVVIPKVPRTQTDTGSSIGASTSIDTSVQGHSGASPGHIDEDCEGEGTDEEGTLYEDRGAEGDMQSPGIPQQVSIVKQVRQDFEGWIGHAVDDPQVPPLREFFDRYSWLYNVLGSDDQSIRDAAVDLWTRIG